MCISRDRHTHRHVVNECLSEESDRERERGEGWQMGGQRRVGGGSKKNKSVFVCVCGGEQE